MATPQDPPHAETRAVAERYARRDAADWRYSRLNPAALAAEQERERALAALLRRHGWLDLGAKRALEVGCGTGANLLDLLRLGFAPANLSGIELLPSRYDQARAVLPQALRLWQGDATGADIAAQSQDLVIQYTVFSSLLDPDFQQRLADAMWRWVKPGGAVLWYDFTPDNPRNADVRGVPSARVRQLFAQGIFTAKRITLAPPIARAVCRVHPLLYPAFNALPLLRTHLLAWIEKPAG